jgi:spore photoproduct lyase
LVYAKSLEADPLCRERLARLLARFRADQVEVVAEEDVPEILRSFGRRQDLLRGGLEGRAAGKELVVLHRALRGEVFPGYAWRELRDGGREREHNGVWCHTAVEIQSVVGCAFDCTYCPYTRFLSIGLDVEEFTDAVTRLAHERRTQTLFKLNNRSDTLGLEPEYGLAQALVERFASLEDKYLMLYSKGDAVDALVSLDHRGKTVACFTLTPEPVARLLEVGAPDIERRIAAVAKLAAAGYPIRVRLSPIVPVREWRAAYAALFDALAKVARPEMITLWTLSMIDVDELGRIVPAEAMDEAILAACRQSAAKMRGDKGAPFPPHVRAEIYRELATMARARFGEAAVALCLENAGVWRELGELVVPHARGRFLCNCAPKATPPAVAALCAGHACKIRNG